MKPVRWVPWEAAQSRTAAYPAGCGELTPAEKEPIRNHLLSHEKTTREGPEAQELEATEPKGYYQEHRFVVLET